MDRGQDDVGVRSATPTGQNERPSFGGRILKGLARLALLIAIIVGAQVGYVAFTGKILPQWIQTFLLCFLIASFAAGVPNAPVKK